MSELQWQAFFLSLKCASLSVLAGVPWGVFWGWLLARRNFFARDAVRTVLCLPLAMPPVLTGWLLLTGFRLVMDWRGVTVASAVVSSPFMVLAVKRAFEAVDSRMEFVARSLGAGAVKRFVRIMLPLTWPSLLSGIVLCFVRSLGEFGATVILAGDIPVGTESVPPAVYTEILSGRRGLMAVLFLVSLLFACLGLSAAGRLQAVYAQRRAK